MSRMAVDIAHDFLTRRRWRVVPVPFRSKAPALKSWQTLRLEVDDLPEYFNGQPSNIGVLLGEPSGGLVDVDLDCREALRLAPTFLPPTRSRFGRPSKRASHWLYVVTSPVDTEKFADPDAPDETGTLVEIRSTGVQTVFPGSTHEGGEGIDWDEDGEQARGEGATLARAVAELAAACLLARHWPAKGRRHDAALAAAGLLVRGGLDEARTVVLVTQAALAAGDDEARDRKRDVLTTVAKLANGEPVTGGPLLAETLRGDGVKVVAALRRWLGLQAPPGAEPLTDLTNAAKFVEQHAATFRYSYAWAAWIHFDGARWRRDAGDVVIRCAKATARGWFAEAAAASDEGRRKALARWATYACSEPGIRRMLTLAQAELAITPDQLDADPWLLNCPNGTLELRTGFLRPHRREDFITQMTAAPYQPDARHPVWEAFLLRVLPDDATRLYVQRAAGYCCTGDVSEEKIFCMHGPTGSGKSTLVGALRNALGDYAATADFASFTTRRGDGPKTDLARLAGKRVAFSLEVNDGTQLAADLLKWISGGDRIVARKLYQDEFEFAMTAKLVLASNDRPRVDDRDDALWRRLIELPFPVAIPAADRDPAVKRLLTDAAQGGPASARPRRSKRRRARIDRPWTRWPTSSPTSRSTPTPGSPPRTSASAMRPGAGTTASATPSPPRLSACVSSTGGVTPRNEAA